MREAFKKAIKNTFTGKFWNFFGGGLGSIVALLLIGKNIWSFTVSGSLVLGLSILVGIYILRFLYFLVQAIATLWFERFRESTYGEAIIALNSAFAAVHELRKNEQYTDETVKQSMNLICDTLKSIYERKTRNKCAVSIKLAKGKETTADTALRNLARDKSSRNRDSDAYNNVEHKIFANTCFNSILTMLSRKKEEAFYCNNNISKTKDYHNTSRQVYENEKLPYDSELVAPIIPLFSDSQHYKLVGFLCVDCVAKDVFDTKYDVAILRGVCDGIFDIIAKHRELIKDTI